MLTDTTLKNAKPGTHYQTGLPCGDYKIAAGNGLYLLVTEKGGKYWRYKYRLSGIEKKGSLGTYPEIGLADARRKHIAERDQIKVGGDPIEIKRRDKATKAVEREKNRPFSEIANEWFDELIEPNYTAHNTLRRYRYNVNVLTKAIGNVLISDIRLAHLTTVLLAFERQGKHATRRRIQADALSIMAMAQDRGYIEVNHFTGVTFKKGYTAPGAVHKSRPAITDAVGFGRLLGDIDRMPKRTGSALRLLALTMLRPGELLQTEWANIDWKKAKLIVPFALLKMRTKRKGNDADGRNLEVPLSRQALAELQALHKLTGGGRYLFPAQSSGSKVRHMRGYMLNRALNRADYAGTHCPHGFRSSASTMLNAERRIIDNEEVPRFVEQKALIELQLDHNDASVQAIYDRGGRWNDRAKLMQLWADRIDEMRGTRLLKLAA